jgi:hypothetical protein
MAVWMLLGVGYMVYLYQRYPGRVKEVGTIHLDLDAQIDEEQEAVA